MSRSRGRRANDSQKINKKKVFAVLITIAVIAMIVFSLKKLLSGEVTSLNEVSTQTTYFSSYDNEKWGIIDNDGNTIISNTYDNMIIVPDKNKALFICSDNVDFDRETCNTKVINDKGEELLSNYSNVQPFENADSSEMWYEKGVLSFESNGKFGVINFEGKQLLDPVYDDISVLPGVKNILVLEKDGNKGLFNCTSSTIIVEMKYKDILTLSSTNTDSYIVKNDSNKFGLIGSDDKQILNTKYDEIKQISSNPYYCVKEGNTLKVIDSQENTILDKGFDDVAQLNTENIVVIKDGKYGVLSLTGDKILDNVYDNISYCYNNCFIAKKDGKYGIIDSTGNNLVNNMYNNITYIKEANFFEAERDDLKTDIIDNTYNVVLPNIVVSELNLDDGYIRIREDQEYKYYNFKFELKDYTEFKGTSTLFLVKKYGKYGYKNKKGELVVDCKYDDATEQNEYGYCAVKKDGKWGCLKSDGSVVVEPCYSLDEYLYVNFVGIWHRYNDLNVEFYIK